METVDTCTFKNEVGIQEVLDFVEIKEFCRRRLAEHVWVSF